MTDKTKKILVYSSLRSSNHWIESLAGQLEFELLTFEDGQAVFDMVKEHLPQFVILGISMPNKGGIDCTQEIKEFSSWVKVILISDVHSLSIQDAAKKARADLFVVESVAAVKVPEFIDAMMQRKELPPDVSENIEREVLSRRGAQRIPFEGEVQYQIGEQWLSGIFVNVSLDGLLFQNKEPIQIGQKLTLSWMDQGEKHIEVFGIVVRQIKADHPQYPYLIGIQFFDTPASLDKTITDFSESESLEFDQDTGLELDLELIREPLSKGSSYFKNIFQGQKAPLFMELTITDIVEHERASFQKSDEYAECVQDLVSCKILCQLIEGFIEKIKSADYDVSKYVGELISMATALLQKIESVESKSDELVKRSMLEAKTTERHQLNESNNRLYQSKASLLRKVSNQVKRASVPESHQDAYLAIVQKNKQLTSYQEHLDSILKEENSQITARAAVTRVPNRISKIVKKIHEITTSKNLFNDKNQAARKSMVLPVFAGTFLLAFLYSKISNVASVHFSKPNVLLSIKIKGTDMTAEKDIEVDLEKDVWDQIGNKGRELVMDQIEVYLTRRKLNQCKIVDGDMLLAAVYRTTEDSGKEAYLHRIFIESPPSPTAVRKNTSKD